MHNILRFFTLFLVVSIVGCGAAIPTVKPYKMDIQQGNVVTSEMLLKLRPGMSKSQVQYIMGTPLLVDSFHSDRWDYFYQLRKQGKIINQRRVILDFEGDALARVRGDVVPEGTDIDALMQQAKSEAEQAEEKPENPDLVVEKIDAPEIETATIADEAQGAVAETVEAAEKAPETTAAEKVVEKAEAATEATPVEAKPLAPMDVPVEDELLDSVPVVAAEEVKPLPDMVKAESDEMAAERAKVVIEDAVSSPTEPKSMPKVDEALIEPPKELAPVIEAEPVKTAPVVEEVEEKAEAVVTKVEEATETVEKVAPPEVKSKPKAAVRPKTTMIPAPPVMGPVAKPKPVVTKPVLTKELPVAPAPVVEEKAVPPEGDVKPVEEAKEIVEEMAPPAVESSTSTKSSAPKVEMVPAPPTPSAKGGFFNLDRVLGTEPEKKTPAAPVEKMQPAAEGAKQATEEEAGLFERTLEFIGF